MTRDHIGHEERTSKVILARGPLLIKEKEIQASNQKGKLLEKATLLLSKYEVQM